jgi:hypothetical protein
LLSCSSLVIIFDGDRAKEDVEAVDSPNGIGVAELEGETADTVRLSNSFATTRTMTNSSQRLAVFLGIHNAVDGVESFSSMIAGGRQKNEYAKTSCHARYVATEMVVGLYSRGVLPEEGTRCPSDDGMG